MTMRDCLTKLAEKSIGKAKGYRSLGKCFGAKDKAAKADMGAAHEDSENDHSDVSETQAQEETNFAEWCLASLKAATPGELEKSFGMDREDIRADGVSGVYAEDNLKTLRMVPRGGAPTGEDIPLSDSFKKVFGID